MEKQKGAYKIKFKEIGSPDIGFISVWESAMDFPFEVKRVFWTYHTPLNVKRGYHAHHETDLVLVALTGTIEVNVEYPDGTCALYILDNPSEGLFIPHFCWHTMRYQNAAFQLVLASTLYSEADYIRDYKDFILTYNDWKSNG